ncbi:hypothetical protein QO259_05530 [Salinicola sp. JS01]|uniref:hypothetical protein n=1 Tax=Salinicola sp. JS01 TaxID=3050071 RepID=UPI00255B778F|nr:hypothetical protein [Salinicola sp. JS01]WIX34123.1 hypothetical protein QO259_05530 [Salinicola sp. JS01]
MQTNGRKTPGRVYLHPAAGSTPESIQRVQRETGMLVVIGTHAARLIPIAAAGSRAVMA